MTKVAGEDLRQRFGTRTVHAGKIPDPLAGAVMTPIYQTSTYIQEALGRHKGYEYARTQNPTREALERNIAALEGGQHGFAFASGLAALDAALKLLSAGDHVVSGENVYGGSHRQMTHIWARLGLDFTFVDAAEADNIATAVTPASFCRMIVSPAASPLVVLIVMFVPVVAFVCVSTYAPVPVVNDRAARLVSLDQFTLTSRICWYEAAGNTTSAGEAAVPASFSVV